MRLVFRSIDSRSAVPRHTITTRRAGRCRTRRPGPRRGRAADARHVLRRLRSTWPNRWHRRERGARRDHGGVPGRREASVISNQPRLPRLSTRCSPNAHQHHRLRGWRRWTRRSSGRANRGRRAGSRLGRPARRRRSTDGRDPLSIVTRFAQLSARHWDMARLSRIAVDELWGPDASSHQELPRIATAVPVSVAAGSRSKPLPPAWTPIFSCCSTPTRPADQAAAAVTSPPAARRAVPGRCLPDRLGHVDEHEHERGAGRAGVGKTRRARCRASQRSRQRVQSSNDVFPTAIHIAVAEATLHDLIPALEVLDALGGRSPASSPRS